MENKYQLLSNLCYGMLVKGILYNLYMQQNPVFGEIYEFVEKNLKKDIYIKLSFDAKSIYICEIRGKKNYIIADYDI